MKNMNQDITQKTYKKLCFEVANSNLSFCVVDMISNKIVTYKSYAIDPKNVLEEELWKVFVENPILEAKYDDVVVLHNSNLNTFVPSSLFDPNYLGSYLQYNSKVFETDYFAFDYLDTYDLNNVFIPYTPINNYLLDHYDTFDYKNSNSIFVKKALDFSKNNDTKQVWVHFQEDRFEIAVTKNTNLLLFNTFTYNSLEDFIYFLLFTYEQLQLNPEIIPVQFLGAISEESDAFKIAYKYIRNCSLLDVSNLKAVLDVPEKDLLKHFILFHS
ncbi:MAG: hypothetical protein CK517_01520 [Flavobacteriales bacterium]|nr:MAG: hypothetical protein CK517_01520 [Flavobacteriales bacterium]